MDHQVKVEVQVSHKQAASAQNQHPAHLDSLCQKLAVAGARYQSEWLTQIQLF